ncbi:hypothetical protein BG005_008426 [Podila minutissima]|nr:hypothetical protein BG005_008426 [Podila minutissima]
MAMSLTDAAGSKVMVLVRSPNRDAITCDKLVGLFKTYPFVAPTGAQEWGGIYSLTSNMACVHSVPVFFTILRSGLKLNVGLDRCTNLQVLCGVATAFTELN